MQAAKAKPNTWHSFDITEHFTSAQAKVTVTIRGAPLLALAACAVPLLLLLLAWFIYNRCSIETCRPISVKHQCPNWQRHAPWIVKNHEFAE